MRQLNLKHRIAIGAVALTAVGGGIAYSAATKPDPRRAYLDDVAKRLEVSPEKLDAALRGAFLDRLDAAVKAGRLTQERADRIKQRVERSGKVPFGFGPRGHRGPGGPGFGPGGPAGPGRRGSGGGGPRHLGAAAKALGMTRPELRAQLRAGKSLADVAKAKGVSVDDLKKALADDVRAKLEQAVKDGRLTAARRDELLKGLDERVAAIVDGRFAPRGRHGGPGRFGPPPGYGPAPGAPPQPPDGDRGPAVAPAPAPAGATAS